MSDNNLQPPISMNESLKKSWSVVIANVWPMAGFTLLYYVVLGILGRIPAVSSLTNILSFILTVSFYSAFSHIMKYGSFTFNDFFGWTPKFGKLLLAQLVLILIVILVFSPMVAIFFSIVKFDPSLFNGSTYAIQNFKDVPIGLMLLTILYILIGGIILMILSFALMYIVLYKDLSTWEAIKFSWRIGRNNIGQILLFMLLALGVLILGALALVVGLLVAIPVVVGMQYFFLHSMFPERETGSWDFMNGQNESTQQMH